MKPKHFSLFATFFVAVGSLLGTSLNFDFEEDNSLIYDDTSSHFVGVEKAPEGAIPTSLTIYYRMNIPNYNEKRFWLWAGGQDGVELEADGVDENYGMYVTINPADWPAHNTFNFIIKNIGTWQGQTLDTAITYADYEFDENGALSVWCIEGVGGQVEVYSTYEETLGARLLSYEFINWTTIEVRGEGPVLSYKLYALTAAYYRLNADLQRQRYENYLIKTGEPEETVEGDEYVWTIEFPVPVRPNVVFQLNVVFDDHPDRTRVYNVSAEPLYKTPRFEEFYTYDGDLGVAYTSTASTFRLWAPTAALVQLRIYRRGTPTYIDEETGVDACAVYDMHITPGGVWETTVTEEDEGDLNGKYYTYYVINAVGNNEVVDPYARSAGVNGIRGMILDLDSTDPEGWEEVPEVWDGVEGYDITDRRELSIYEIHIRDLTMDDTWNGKSPRGTFPAFYEKGTTYTQDGVTVKTGFDHIEELGVNALQILPFFDQDNGEIDVKFNWGYNPLNYNVLEGGYSTDPYDGAVRVEEFKTLVKEYAQNANHTRVIMDVVYNHVSSVSSNNLNKIMPRYYFRTNEEGFYTDGAGCGNEVKTEATMASKFIVDSVVYWASEFKIKGFRFDLMGLIDTGTMDKVRKALYEVDPDIVVYGEGWTAGGYNGEAGTKGTDTAAAYSDLYPTEENPSTVGGFNDGGRNAIRGGNDFGYGTNVPYPGYGFISQGASDVAGKANEVVQMLQGVNSYGGYSNAVQTLNYASCHDNYTAWDQLNYTLKETDELTPGPEDEPNPELVATASVAVHAAVMFSQGVAFMQSGEEIFRSKVLVMNDDPDNPDNDAIPYPDLPSYRDPNAPDYEPGPVCTPEVRMYGKIISHNSYRSSDLCNAFQYDRKISITDYNGVKHNMLPYFEKFQEMIQVRKEIIHQTLIDFPDNTSITKGWQTDSGSTAFGFCTERTTGGNYYIAFSGRADNNSVSMDMEPSTLVFNSRIDGIANCASMERYQLLMYAYGY